MHASPLNDNDQRPIDGTFADSTALLEQPEDLRARAREDGMLYFRGLLSRDEILSARRNILEVLDRYGLVDRRYPLLDGMADTDAVNRYEVDKIRWNGVGVPVDVYRDIQKLESFHALAQTEKLMEALKVLFQSEPFAHPRNIGRIMIPHRELKPTPSHQDYIHVQGTENTWTCWLPLGDIPRELGGLAVLRGSHTAGVLGIRKNPESGLESILCGLDHEWQTVDYEAGDVLLFHSLTVHKALANRIPGKIRISCDYRYQPATAPIETRSLLPHGPYTWEELYEGWTCTELQYYWKSRSFEYEPFKDQIRWQQEKIC